jgi:hypothetical protein
MIKKLCAFALMIPALLMGLPKNDFFNLEDLRPGMKGIGKTCYQGVKPEEFQVEILGVLHGVNPGSNAVLARLSGSHVDKVGVFEGMSGSPVFIDGKLLGAIAFSFSFSKEAICGITPIKEMIESFDAKVESSPGPSAALNRSMLWNYRRALQDQAMSLFIPSTFGGRTQNVISSMGGHALMPIATPLSLSGLNGRTLKMFEAQFRAMGMTLLQGSGRATLQTGAQTIGVSEDSPLEPGSNVVVSLVRGDLDISAGGTVTYVDDKKIYAFGHNMFQLGSTELPMHRARAITVVPSVENSFKILETGGLAGTIRQDRGSGIYGIIGETPRMVPLKILLTTSRGVQKEYKYELARDSFLTPLLVNVTVYNTIISSERAQGPVTLNVTGTIGIRNERPVEINSRFSSDSSAPSSASLSVAVPLNYIMAAGYKNFDLDKIDLEISSQESDRSAILDSIRVGKNEVRAGEILDLEVSYKKANGEVLQEKYPFKIPENITPGLLNLLVADGDELMSLDEQDEGDSLVPRDLSQLIRFINNIRKNDHLYMRLFRNEPGVAIKGEGLPGLPPSMLSILRSQRKTGALIPIHSSTFMEYELPPSDYMVAGSKVLKVTIKP